MTFCWVDIETTGLDERAGSLLEVGLVVTDNDLNHLGARVVQVALTGDAVAGLDPWCLDAHTGNGLLNHCRAVGVPVSDAEDVLVQFMAEHFDGQPKPPMCGSSVHFDRRWLAHHMPRLEAQFHYRNIDISTIKELVRRWYPTSTAPRPNPQDMHRAIPDLLDTLDEARFYRNTFFVH